jgi:hypothetical protein
MKGKTRGNKIEIVGGYAYLHMNQEKLLRIDIESITLFEGYTWTAMNVHGNWYAIASRFVTKEKPIYAHIRIMNPSKGQWVDHKDGNGLNCTKENMRFCTHHQNNINRCATRNNKTGVKGCSLTSSGKYQATVTYQQKAYHLGTFSTLELAAEAYKTKAKELFGEFYRDE